MNNFFQNIISGMIFCSSQLFSQPDFPDAPNQGPIGGLALVLLAFGGIALGYKKLKK